MACGRSSGEDPFALHAAVSTAVTQPPTSEPASQECPQASLPDPTGTDHPAFRIAGSVHEVLGICIEEATAQRAVLSLPVTWKVRQPYGVLHGGISVVLAESAAGIGASMAAPGQQVLGVDINATHLRTLRSGILRAIATPLRIGRTLQVWDVDIRDHRDRAVCRARCTLAVARWRSARDERSAGGPRDAATNDVVVAKVEAQEH